MKRPPRTLSASPKATDPDSPDPIDPAVYWALGEGEKYFFLPWRQNQEWLPVVIQLGFISPEKFLKIALPVEKRKTFLGDVIQFSPLAAPSVPDVHALPTDADSFTAIVNKSFFDRLANNDKFRAAVLPYIKRLTLGLPLDSISLPPSQGGPRR